MNLDINETCKLNIKQKQSKNFVILNNNHDKILNF